MNVKVSTASFNTSLVDVWFRILSANDSLPMIDVTAENTLTERIISDNLQQNKLLFILTSLWRHRQ